jgi:hypothetical protein
MLTREQIAEMVRLFLPASSNEARLSDQIDTYIHKAHELGFLRQVRGSEQVYEVRRILKAFVDGQWLADFNLTGFVREHMLEPFDAGTWTAKIVAHFEDLTNAHEAVRRAQAQIAALGPLLGDCDAHDKITVAIDAATAQRSASRFFFAEAKAGLSEDQIQNLDTERAVVLATRDQLDDRLAELRDKETSLNLQRASAAGYRELYARLVDDDLPRFRRAGRALDRRELAGRVPGGLDAAGRRARGPAQEVAGWSAADRARPG